VTQPVALIIGAGPGISGAFAARLVAAGFAVALASRDLRRLEPLAAALGATAYAVDAAAPDSLRALFSTVEAAHGAPEVVLFNPSSRVRGDLLTLDIGAASLALQSTAQGALVTAQEAARRMLPRGRGAIFFTGATASIKGYARSSVFAMAKFAVRGLAQSLARELGPAGIHVAHFVIDGSVARADDPANDFTPEAIAQSYMAVLAQPRGAWTWEIELRSHREPF
jgi:NAD(P)-dependent dehydrogenase (short-subunit alcohol dehydrogenase family)